MAKTKLTKNLIEKAVSLKEAGLSNKDVCKALGISEETFYAWQRIERATPLQAEFSERLTRAETQFKQSLLQEVLRQGMERDWRACAWLLERLYPQEFGRVDRLQAEVGERKEVITRHEFYFDYGDE